jgi:hypothetical protein
VISRLITSLPADDMVWFVFQVLRSSEAEFSKNERKEILERMTQIFSFELDPFSVVLNNIWIDYFGKRAKMLLLRSEMMRPSSEHGQTVLILIGAVKPFCHRRLSLS